MNSDNGMNDDQDYNPPNINRVTAEAKLRKRIAGNGVQFPPSVSAIDLSKDESTDDNDTVSETNGSDVFDFETWCSYLNKTYETREDAINGLSELLSWMNDLKVSEEDNEFNLFDYTLPDELDDGIINYICLMSGGKFDNSVQFIQDRLEDFRDGEEESEDERLEDEEVEIVKQTREENNTNPSKIPKETLTVLQSDIVYDALQNDGKDDDGDAEMGQEGE